MLDFALFDARVDSVIVLQYSGNRRYYNFKHNKLTDFVCF